MSPILIAISIVFCVIFCQIHPPPIEVSIDLKNRCGVFFDVMIKNPGINRDVLRDNVLAGAEGIEPSSMVLETTVLPLYYAPIADKPLIYYKPLAI